LNRVAIVRSSAATAIRRAKAQAAVAQALPVAVAVSKFSPANPALFHLGLKRNLKMK
jgi:hypothetical protein